MKEGIVEDIRVQLGINPLPLEVAAEPVAMLQRLQPILTALNQHGVVGLWGMGGIGKTTLARAVYNQLQPNFHDSCSYIHVGQNPDIVTLQQELIDSLCISPSHALQSHHHDQLKRQLKHRKVLLMLDDVWTRKHLKQLLVPLHCDSRVVITSRHQDLLQQTLPRLCCANLQPEVLEVPYLSQAESLELFCLHAFKELQPPAAWQSITEEIADKCFGLPLSLEVVGEFLWQKQKMEEWQDALLKLQHAESINGSRADEQLFSSLQLSYDDLCKQEKSMFIDIACTLHGQLQEMAIAAWGQMAQLRLRNLVNHALISNTNSRLVMHDQLRALGRRLDETACRHTNISEVCL